MENCHWGNTVPNATWCPWNYFRTCGDIEASFSSVLGNLQTVFQWATKKLSAPGCWAYPDMLEVGCAHGPHGPNDPGLSFVEARSHFNAWCIVSSPLILSHDTNNDTIMDEIWPIISNVEAIAVNQAWAGESGNLFASSSTPLWQQIYKPVNSTATAVLLMNQDSSTNSITVTFSQIPSLPSATSYNVRDINAHQDLGSFTTSFTSTNLASHDSAFLLIVPSQ